MLARPQDVPAQIVGASLGDAMLAALALDPTAAVDVWNPVDTVVQPVPERRVRYDVLYDAYRSLYPATRDAAHMLARIQEGGDACVQ